MTTRTLSAAPAALVPEIRRAGLDVLPDGRLACVLCGGVFRDLSIGGGRMPWLPLPAVRWLHHASRDCRRRQALARRAARARREGAPPPEGGPLLRIDLLSGTDGGLEKSRTFPRRIGFPRAEVTRDPS